MKSQVLSIYLDGFLLRPRARWLERGLGLWCHTRIKSVLHHQRIRLTGHALSLSSSVGCQLLSVHRSTIKTGSFRRGRRIVCGRGGLRTMSVHVHFRLVALHLHHLGLLASLNVSHLLLGTMKGFQKSVK